MKYLLTRYIKVECDEQILYLSEKEWYEIPSWEREEYIYLEKTGYFNLKAIMSRCLHEK